MNKIGSIMTLIFFSVLTFVSIVPIRGAVTFTPETHFEIPENNRFNFWIGGSYNSSNLEGGTWNFVGLALDSYVLDLGDRFIGGVLYGKDVLRYCHNDGNFSVSVQNCNITITSLDVITVVAPFSGWLNYTVSGVGNQTFNLHYYLAAGRASWIVYIDGVAKQENDGWSISRSSTDEWITVTGATNNVSIYYDELGPSTEPRYGPPTEPSNDPQTEIKKDIQSDIERNIGIIILALTLTIIIILSSYLILRHKTKQNTLHSLS